MATHPDSAAHGVAERPDLATFVGRAAEQGRALYRDLPWRRTRDPYAVLVSEVMLQQTQVTRVDGR
jgi:A/G-specific adenine glycosylase